MSDWKVMMIVAFHQNRIIVYRILPQNVNVNFEVYLSFLSEVLHPAIREHRIKRPLILHDNARPHKHEEVQRFFKRHQWEELKHPPYSPDLNPCDYDGIARIKRPNKGMRFADENELHAAYDRVIEEINLNNEATGIRHLPQRWAMVTQTGGEYIV
jgi:histone-lysine N-methyltransferase SETMAR